MLKYIKRVLLILLIGFIIIPYLIPLSKPTIPLLPYANSHQFVSNMTTIHYRLYEPELDVFLGKILLVHGLGGSTYSYEKNASILAEAGYQVVTVDLPGFGYSSRNTDEDHSQLNRAHLLWQLLDELDQNQANDILDKSWHLGGHSMGGGTVSAMAYQRPSSTASLILIDGALFETSRRGGITSLPVISRWLQVLLEHYLIKPERFEDFLASAYGQSPQPEDILGYYEPLSIPGTARSAISLLKTAENMPSDNLSQLSMPVLALWGEKDTWVPVDETKRIQAELPQTTVIIINEAAHCPMETHPEEFNKYLLDWLTN
jgi:2-hydroxy-6-oxonona-2,4-dienedioate hydrolase